MPQLENEVVANLIRKNELYIGPNLAATILGLPNLMKKVRDIVLISSEFIWSNTSGVTKVLSLRQATLADFNVLCVAGKNTQLRSVIESLSATEIGIIVPIRASQTGWFAGNYVWKGAHECSNLMTPASWMGSIGSVTTIWILLPHAFFNVTTGTSLNSYMDLAVIRFDAAL